MAKPPAGNRAQVEEAKLRRRQDRLFGILNGVDHEEWNPLHDPFLKHPYSAARLAGKRKNKIELQKELGLPVAADAPLFGTITRLAEQKGVDIQLAALETSTRCLVLTGDQAPNQIITARAREAGIPIVVVPTDTLATVEKLEKVLGRIRIREAQKVRRAQEFLRDRLNYRRIIQKLDL